MRLSFHRALYHACNIYQTRFRSNYILLQEAPERCTTLSVQYKIHDIHSKIVTARTRTAYTRRYFAAQ